MRVKTTEALLLALLAALFTCYVISWSETRGKLSVPPDYDDSHSLVEGALRLHTFQESGLTGLVKEYIAIVPHSFLHYYYTSIVFATFGIHQSAVYWCNGVLLFGVLLVFYSILPPMPVVQKLCFASAFLGIPVCFHLVQDFRSEITMAGLLFIGSGLLVKESWQQKENFWLLIAAISVFLIAFGIKPAMFPYTAGILALCSLLYLYAGLSLRKPWPKTMLNLLLIWLISPLFLILHLYFHRSEVIGYISQVAFKSDFYRLHNTATWSFHWLGGSGVWHLSAMKTVMMLIVAGVLILAALRRMEPYQPDRIWYSFTFLMFGSFAGIAINQINNFFFGMTFQLFLTATSLAGLSYIYLNKRLFVLPILGTFIFFAYWFPAVSNRYFAIPAAMIILILAAFIHFGKIPTKNIPGIIASGIFALLCWQVTQIAPFHDYRERTLAEAGPDGLQWRQEGPSLVFAKLRPLWNPKHPLVVWVASYGWVDARTLSWQGILAGIPWRMYNYDDLPLNNNQVVPESANLIIVPEEGIAGRVITETTASSRDTKILDFLNKHHYRMIASVQAPLGKSVTIYSSDQN